MKKEIIDVLEKEFDSKQASLVDVINRLNKAFQQEWSHVVMEHQWVNDTLVVRVRISVRDPIVKILIEHDGWGSAKLVANIDTGDLYNIAISKALKKAASCFGVGLHLYANEEAQLNASAPTDGRQNPNYTQLTNGSYINVPPEMAARIPPEEISNIVNIEWEHQPAIAKQILARIEQNNTLRAIGINPDGPASTAQIRTLNAVASQKGMSPPELIQQSIGSTLQHQGYNFDSFEQLTYQVAQDIIKWAGISEPLE